MLLDFFFQIKVQNFISAKLEISEISQADYKTNKFHKDV
jgi:hypothetical protein